MTLGVRAVIFDATGRVLLVRHSYVRGWHLPGGAVEAGETVEQALRREVREEAAIAIDSEPVLHGIFFNRAMSRRDHVLVYVVHAFSRCGEAGLNSLEIVATGFFAPDALPQGTTGATRRRITEIVDNRARVTDW